MRSCLSLALLAGSIVLLHSQEDEDLFEGADEEDSGDHEADEEEEDDYEEGGDVTMEDMHTLHAHFDGNKDGKVSLAEILEFNMKARKVIAANEVEDLYGEALAEKGGLVSLEEYMEVADLNLDSADAKKLEAEKFAAADANKDGSLDKSELAHLVDPVLHAKVLDFHINGEMQIHDKNQDGKLSAEEWKSYEDLYETEFKHVDTNHDGSIDLDELKQHEIEGHLKLALQKLLEDHDKDGDKHFSKDELGSVANVIEKYQLEDHIEEWLYHYLEHDREEM